MADKLFFILALNKGGPVKNHPVFVFSLCLVLDTQVELALAYKCEDKLDNKRLVLYIHFNIHVNSLRIDAMGNLVSS